MSQAARLQSLDQFRKARCSSPGFQQGLLPFDAPLDWRFAQKAKIPFGLASLLPVAERQGKMSYTASLPACSPAIHLKGKAAC